MLSLTVFTALFSQKKTYASVGMSFRYFLSILKQSHIYCKYWVFLKKTRYVEVMPVRP
jgi:hypothetical protein